MNTTENISIGGLAFTIETDAYNELEGYIEDIRTCFQNDPYGNEIVEDIETRISELLKEKCKSGIVVNLSMVKEIQKIIGDPKELSIQDGEGSEDDRTEREKSAPRRSEWRERRIYRDIDNRMLGGVCSGLGEYLNLDKVIFRVLFMVFFVLGLIDADDGLFTISVITYIILWIAMPAARTVEEKCEMKRKPIDLEGFKSKENNVGREVKEVVSSPVGRTLGRIFTTVIGIILLVSGIGGLFSGIFIPSIHEIAETAVISELSPYDAEEMLVIDIIRSDTFWWMITGSMGIACIGMIYSGIMLTFDFKSPKWRPGLILFIIWIISILVITAWILSKVAEWIPSII